MVSYNLGSEDGVLLSLPHCTKRVDMAMFMGGKWGKDGEETLVSTSGEVDVHEWLHVLSLLHLVNVV
jgi:hypothetical protein